MKPIDKINTKIDSWSESLCGRILEMKHLEVSEMKTAIVVYIKRAIFDCTHLSILETEKLYNQKKVIRQNYQGANENDINAELIQIKEKLKLEKILYAQLDVENMNAEMIKFFRAKDNDSVLEFYKYYNSKFPHPKRDK